MRHRQAVAIPFVVMALAALIGGWINTVSARGTVVDDSTGQPVPNVTIALVGSSSRDAQGSRATTSGPDGRFAFENLPRTGRVTAQGPGYAQAIVDPATTEVRLQPTSLTLQVNEEGAAPPIGVPNPKVRLGDAQIGNGGPTGSVVVVPYPAVGTPLLVCADGYTSKTITAKGAVQDVTLAKGGSGCPPLPTPSPVPGASPSPAAPSPSPAAPSASPAAPTPSASPSP